MNGMLYYCVLENTRPSSAGRVFLQLVYINIGNKQLPQSVLQDKGIGIIESQKGDKDIQNVKIRKAVSR